MKGDVSENWIIIVRAGRSVQRVGLCYASSSVLRKLSLGTSTRRSTTPWCLASRTGCAGTQKPIGWLLSSPPSRARTHRESDVACQSTLETTRLIGRSRHPVGRQWAGVRQPRQRGRVETSPRTP